MANELAMFHAIGLYEEVPHPPDRKIIDLKWVYKIKQGPTGDVDKYKAQLITKGLTQVHGIDYMETFAPVAKFSTIRTLLTLAAMFDLEIHQMDVKSTFLNGKLEEEIYLHPPGFRDSSDVVWHLYHALYGLKQAPKAWYNRLREVFESLGFTCSDADHSLFYKDKNGILIIVAVYVDNKLILSKSCKAIDCLKVQLSAEYDLSDLGKAQWILSMEIIKLILECMGMQDGRTVSTPIEQNLKLEKLDTPAYDLHAYQSALGALMYAMLATQPDLAFTVGVLSRHAATPGDQHWTKLKQVYRYLRKTVDVCLQYTRDFASSLVGYADADWAADVNDCCSVTGYVFTLSGGAVSWSSKKQTSVALSSTEAEYMAVSAAAKEILWLRMLLHELDMDMTTQPTSLLVDNQSAIALTSNAMFHNRTKHIAIRHYFICKKVEDGEVDVKYISMNEQITNVLTKGLSCEKHECFSLGMGIIF
ncbi:hypothetical protein M404DRAFT_30611 [Pisolithus tinctorius Marx 270]|uniref:Reverse transcriptase Ty1/copia-type domain-containing protein n=1 Tax=Pisolithus tinctorius Marx 270 TaxID=870435 RepID=A0A0C3NVA4_PISTI|nr:hypothetical protein M404DRAFT_30611 [Pisolithus tinctorius Marx 270]